MRNLLFFLVAILIAGCAASNTSTANNINADADFNHKAIQILKPKCEAGNLSACNDLAISYQNLQNHQTAFKIYEKNCKMGHQKSCTNLANIYMYGDQIGLQKDMKKGIEIHRNSCMNNGADSCYYLGEFYRLGIDAKEPDYQNAFEAYSRGCAMGDIASCTNTGGLYELGLGVKKDEYRALQIYKSSCYSGDASACDNVKRIRGY
ncbi:MULTISPECIES: tetratricopeptide repeat protein [unclassified Campylobacter]|uniref:tetratricopeptide repeat protein n=1 Tax=unclassified Campylobacter TaxID=2593542 RepID=UPI0014744305|nr:MULTISPECIES: tetratricopeptide repeat protein [unclassified Campylobacter]